MVQKTAFNLRVMKEKRKDWLFNCFPCLHDLEQLRVYKVRKPAVATKQVSWQLLQPQQDCKLLSVVRQMSDTQVNKVNG